jgi:hypothetical protein
MRLLRRIIDQPRLDTNRPITRSGLSLLACVALLSLSQGAWGQAASETRFPATADGVLPTVDGFRGIWYSNQPLDNQYKYKYSGGLATYPQQHHPIAVYAKEVNKTFFVYGGRYANKNRLLHTISFYDHDTGKVARPRVLLDKATNDAHDNPVLAIDDEGYLWIFSNAHGTMRPAYIHRSTEPYSIDAFELVKKTNFSYGQPYHLEEHGFVVLHTRYGGGRRLYVMRSENGQNWSEPKLLAAIENGQYQVSWPKPDNRTIGTAFNFHPADAPGRGLNWRTNLYYMQTPDAGRSWYNAAGEKLTLPLRKPQNAALVRDYQKQDRRVYVKDVQYDQAGRPVILYLTSEGYASGPKNDPRWFTIAHWTGEDWQTQRVMQGDNNYDFASLYLRGPKDWRLIAATRPSPQPYNTGGEVSVWRSNDQGANWRKTKALTENSPFNHNYPRRPLNYNPEFAALWADGHGRKQSQSRLYISGIDQPRALRLPVNFPKGQPLALPEPYRTQE